MACVTRSIRARATKQAAKLLLTIPYRGRLMTLTGQAPVRAGAFSASVRVHGKERHAQTAMALGRAACGRGKPSGRCELRERWERLPFAQEGRYLEDGLRGRITPGRPADRLHHHGVVARVRDRSEAVQLSGQGRPCRREARA